MGIVVWRSGSVFALHSKRRMGAVSRRSPPSLIMKPPEGNEEHTDALNSYKMLVKKEVES